jgi:hypothetical protein
LDPWGTSQGCLLRVLVDDRPIDRTLLDPAGHPVKRGSVLPDDPRRPKWRTPVPGSLICRISASAPVSGNRERVSGKIVRKDDRIAGEGQVRWLQDNAIGAQWQGKGRRLQVAIQDSTWITAAAGSSLRPVPAGRRRAGPRQQGAAVSVARPSVSN